MVSWQTAHKASYRLCYLPQSQSYNHLPTVRVSHHLNVWNGSKAGDEDVCFHLCDTTCNSQIVKQNVRTQSLHVKLWGQSAESPPDPGRSLLSYPSRSRSKMRVMLSEIIFSFPLTSLRLKRNKMLQQINPTKGKVSAAMNPEILKSTGN